ncbi:MAG: amidohydrolase family protein [Gemmatimonadota bacterium]
MVFHTRHPVAHRRRPRWSLLLLAIALSVPARAMRAQAPDTTATYIKAARLFDSETATLVGPRIIRVRGRMIEAVEERMTIPPGARVIDRSRFTVLPGLIDAHTHLLYLGNSGRFGDVALKQAIADGSVVGPPMFVSGPGLSPIGGQFPGLTPEAIQIAEEEYRIVRSPDDAVWRAASAGVNSIEHAYQAADSTLALMARNGVALVPTDIDSVTFEQLMVRDAARNGQPPPSPALIAQYIAPQRERLRRAIAAGVIIVAGSDNYLDMKRPQGAAAKRNLFAYAQSGMSNAQVLQAATRNAARLIGQHSRVGVIAPGRFADIIAVEGDPLTRLEALEHVTFVMANGHVHTGAP